MSNALRFDTITDRLGTGAPSFPNSLNVTAATGSFYEKGTFSITIAGGTTAGSYTITTNAGRYTKIGNMCYIGVDFTITAIGTAGTGNLLISGMPPKTATVTASVGGIYLSGVAFFAGSSLSIAFDSGGASSALAIVESTSNTGPSNVNCADISVNDRFWFSLAYEHA